jgi:hypothetical protein
MKRKLTMWRMWGGILISVVTLQVDMQAGKQNDLISQSGISRVTERK